MTTATVKQELPLPENLYDAKGDRWSSPKYPAKPRCCPNVTHNYYQLEFHCCNWGVGSDTSGMTPNSAPYVYNCTVHSLQLCNVCIIT